MGRDCSPIVNLAAEGQAAYWNASFVSGLLKVWHLPPWPLNLQLLAEALASLAEGQVVERLVDSKIWNRQRLHQTAGSQSLGFSL